MKSIRKLKTAAFIGFGGFVLYVAQCSSATEIDVEKQFLDGLLARRLFSLAEAHCQRHLERDDLDDVQRSEWTVGLIRVFAERARHAPIGRREPIWQQARKFADEFAKRHPDSQRLPLVRLPLK